MMSKIDHWFQRILDLSHCDFTHSYDDHDIHLNLMNEFKSLMMDVPEPLNQKTYHELRNKLIHIINSENISSSFNEFSSSIYPNKLYDKNSLDNLLCGALMERGNYIALSNEDINKDKILSNVSNQFFDKFSLCFFEFYQGKLSNVESKNTANNLLEKYHKLVNNEIISNKEARVDMDRVVYSKVFQALLGSIMLDKVKHSELDNTSLKRILTMIDFSLSYNSGNVSGNNAILIYDPIHFSHEFNDKVFGNINKINDLHNTHMLYFKKQMKDGLDKEDLIIQKDNYYVFTSNKGKDINTLVSWVLDNDINITDLYRSKLLNHFSVSDVNKFNKLYLDKSNTNEFFDICMRYSESVEDKQFFFDHFKFNLLKYDNEKNFNDIDKYQIYNSGHLNIEQILEMVEISKKEENTFFFKLLHSEQPKQYQKINDAVNFVMVTIQEAPFKESLLDQHLYAYKKFDCCYRLGLLLNHEFKELPSDKSEYKHLYEEVYGNYIDCIVDTCLELLSHKSNLSEQNLVDVLPKISFLQQSIEDLKCFANVEQGDLMKKLSKLDHKLVKFKESEMEKLSDHVEENNHQFDGFL